MKLNKINKSLFLALFGLCLLPSCQENLMELDKGDTELKLSVSNETVVLNEKDASATALELTWTSGTNYGTGARMSYQLEIAKAGTDFANSDVLIAEQQFDDKALSRKFTVQELNSYLRDAGLSLKDGEEIALEAKVTANVVGYADYTQTSTVAFKVTTYKPVSSTLYICGDATTGGWAAEAMQELTLVNVKQPGIFSIKTNLQADKEFKFFTQKDLGTVAFVRDPNSPEVLNDGDTGKLLEIGEGVADLKYKVAETHAYKITVNLLEMTVKVEYTEDLGPAYDQLYFVGSFNNWGFTPMKVDPVNPFVFLYADLFIWNGGGEFKFGTADGDYGNMYKAKNENAPYTDTEVVFVSGFEPDNKWALKESECGKAYKIRLDITAGKEKMEMTLFEPFTEMYIVGEAAPNGWDLGKATPMDKVDDYTFRWTGDLKAGEIKFSCDKQSDWNGAWFMAVENGADFATGDMYYVNKKTNSDYSGIDLKWKVAEAGNYTIELNQATEKLTVTKN